MDLKNEIQQQSVLEKINSTVDYATGIIGPTTENQQF